MSSIPHNVNFSSLQAQNTLTVNGNSYEYHAIQALEQFGFGPVSRYPYSIRILLENLLRYHSKGLVSDHQLQNMAQWSPDTIAAEGTPFMPARVVLQDFTGVPALVDLAALRSAVARQGGAPEQMNPFIPVDLVIDHSIQVDKYGSFDAFGYNVAREMERNHERYIMLNWGQKAFKNFRVVPPGTGIVHQVNLEYLATVAATLEQDGKTTIFPDSVLGTDSHTTMINGIGVMGWGVGGIEAEAVLLGQPYTLQIPEVIGMRLEGSLPAGTTATDLVLTITQYLREKGVVGRFVEFFGPGLQTLSLPDRATIANMSPEYGATMGFFPVDQETLRYLSNSGRSDTDVQLVEQYYKAARLFYSQDEPDPQYTTVYTIELESIVPSLAGPRRPQDRLPLAQVPADFTQQFTTQLEKSTPDTELDNGAVVIAAITSCTNTSNPDVMIGAGLLAQKAVARGLQCKPWVKTSLAPGSKVVSGYLEKANLLGALESLGFHVVGYGCTTCIGNSGPLDQEIADIISEKALVTAAVISGNRNFEARIHPQIQANYLGSPLMVIAYALAGNIQHDIENEPLGTDASGTPVYLKDIWPTREEIRQVVQQTVTPDLFSQSYATVFEGDEQWQQLGSSNSNLFAWDTDSSYIQEPPFFKNIGKELPKIEDIKNARILALFGDTITTDHISPAGAIAPDSPAGQYLQSLGINHEDFNSYGSRRGNHEVMMRGTFANIRIKNQMVDREGGYTRLMPGGEVMPIYDAAMQYQQNNTPLVVFGGKDYGTGSSRDWAAKGTMLLGVKAVIVSSFERIHRSNLVGMGVLPLQFEEGTDTQSLGLTGEEMVSIQGIGEKLSPKQHLTLTIERPDHSVQEVKVLVRLDNQMEVEYFYNGGILQMVLRQILAG
ncbi:MAG: aconitate hydratase AcnA [Desulfobulbus propionicus]|nr:MAG: aconitate hydratase AcnA [Desulfobulbus propionicus]